MDNNLVVWEKRSMYYGNERAKFTWASALWQLDESFELVHMITLCAGEPDPVELTASMLACKICI